MTDSIKELWRYPVKSMGGETLDRCTLGGKGALGDRGWAVRDDKAGEVRGGRYLPNLLHCRARYMNEPDTEPWPTAIITLPDGTEFESNADNANELLTNYLDHPVSIWPIQPPENADHYRRLPVDEEILRKEFAREPDEPVPDLQQFPEILMTYTSEPGTYFDVAPVHVLTTATLQYLSNKNPDSSWISRRFRPNIVIDTGDAEELMEIGWIGKTLTIGDLQLRCTAPAPRCAITMHPQGNDIEKDPNILRTIVSEADQNVGVYCDIVAAGSIAVGDNVLIGD